MIDILENKQLEKQVLDKGLVKIIDVMPRLVQEGETCDNAIAQAARVSYGGGTKSVSDDKTLIRYLMRHGHSSPLEMIEFKFLMKLPVFCARQIIRTRTASVNEESARYSVVKDEYYIPKSIRTQSTTNNQGSEKELTIEESDTYNKTIEEHCKNSYQIYENLLKNDITREQARMVLPQNMYTSWYWKIDLNNLLKTLSLRCDKHAQWETRQYADAMLELITPLVPISIEAFNEYYPLRNATLFTEKECNKLSYFLGHIEFNDEVTKFDLDLNSGNKREDKEWIDKLKKVTKLEV